MCWMTKNLKLNIIPKHHSKRCLGIGTTTAIMHCWCAHLAHHAACWGCIVQPYVLQEWTTSAWLQKCTMSAIPKERHPTQGCCGHRCALMSAWTRAQWEADLEKIIHWSARCLWFLPFVMHPCLATPLFPTHFAPCFAYDLLSFQTPSSSFLHHMVLSCNARIFKACLLWATGTVISLSAILNTS